MQSTQLRYSPFSRNTPGFCTRKDFEIWQRYLRKANRIRVRHFSNHWNGLRQDLLFFSRHWEKSTLFFQGLEACALLPPAVAFRIFDMKTLFAVLLSVASLSASGAPYYTAHVEAEAAAVDDGSRIDTEYFPYVGEGYVSLLKRDAAVEWSTVSVPRDGKYTLLIKYANGSGEERPCRIEVNGNPVETQSFPSVYSDWCYYWNARVSVDLKEGDNTIRISAATDCGGPNIDNIAVSSDGLVAPSESVFDVRSFGAKGDGSTDDTQAIRAAIDACTPGGTVVLSNGVFMSGQIRLKSNMIFWIDQTATLRAIQKAELFPDADPPSNNVNVADELGQAFIYSQGADNLNITGGGTVDGNGECEIWSREKDESIRPIPIYLTQGKNIKVTHIDIIRGAMWSLVPLECDKVIIDGININSTFGKNKDGIDPCDCHNVLIANCTLTVEDDALCPKSGHVRGCENITYRNITVNRTICGLVKLGTKSYGHFKNIVFEDLALYGTQDHKKSNVAVNLSTVDGADIENIIVRRANIRNAATGVFIMHGAGGKARTPKGDSDKTGSVTNILIEDLDIRECHDPFGNFITGTRRNGTVYKVEEVVLRNVRIECKGGMKTVPDEPKEYTSEYPNYDWCRGTLPAWGYTIRHAQNIVFENCVNTVAPEDAREEMVLVDAEQVTVDGVPAGE
jgi:hypothetical protein